MIAMTGHGLAVNGAAGADEAVFRVAFGMDVAETALSSAARNTVANGSQGGVTFR
jgi:hypothetical protein